MIELAAGTPAAAKGRASMEMGRRRHLMQLDVVALVAIVIASIVLKLVLLEPAGPILFFDEMLYGLGARAIAGDGVYPSGHYPFLYPLFLAPHVLLGSGYDGFVVGNIVATSTLPVAAWLLARASGAGAGTPSAICAALLPIHFVFPTQVMAENLFVPMFAFAAWYAVRGRIDGRVASLCFGAWLAGLFLTKYLALPTVPLLAAFWLYGARQGGAGHGRLLSGAVCATTGAALLVAAWVAFAAHSGIGTGEAFGGGLSDYRDNSLVMRESVALWAVVYLAALILTCGPAFAKLLEQCLLFLRRPLGFIAGGAYERLVVLTLLLAGGYVLVCIHHSASLAMNYPEPQRVVARYFMHLTVLFVVVGVCGIAHGVGRRAGPVVTVLASAACGLGIWAAWSVLYENAVWTFTEWFAAIPLYATDIMGYKGEGVLSTAIFVGTASLLMARIPVVRWLYPLAIAVILLEASSYVGGKSRIETAFRPLHARMLAPHVIADIERGETVLVVADIPRLPPEDIRQALIFWGATPERFVVVGSERTSGLPQADRVYRLTRKRITGLAELQTYQTGEREGLIYRGQAELLQLTREDPQFPEAPVDALLHVPCGEREVATLSWDFSAMGVAGVAIYVDGGDDGDRLFARQAGAGHQDTGEWVVPGTRFRFRNPADGRLLAEVEPDWGACTR